MRTRKPTIAIIGPGNLGSAMARALHAAGYRVTEIVHHGKNSARRARTLAREVKARVVHASEASPAADIAWICVGDSAIAACAAELAKRGGWRGKLAFHSSGALGSRELKALQKAGTAVASVHPMMTFVRDATPELKGVTFAIEGDARAARAARQITHDLGGRVVKISVARKPLYHALGAFTSPLIVATIAAAERLARKVGLDKATAQATVGPILQQTVRNYLKQGTAGAFSGPLVRGDVETVKRHLKVLQADAEARAAYVALARSAMKSLPVKNKKEIRRLLKKHSG
ncbi:MAG TPA: DUF2520 domain-containing protein [Terriglobales bacterium]|nr:DUF2520 domain-containing protein [Terriglobales bacterium]